jgi:hypothetical protein
MDPFRLCVCLLPISHIQVMKSTIVDDAIHVEVEVIESGY